MENEIKIEQNKKIYRVGDITGASLLAGPLTAAFLISRNFKTLNMPEMAKKTWIYAIIFTIILIVGINFLPEAKGSKIGIPFLFTVIIRWLATRHQGSKIQSFINSGGKVHNLMHTLGIGILGLIITVVLALTISFSISLIKGDLLGQSSVKYYGKAKHEVVYNSDYVSEAEIDSIAEGLTKTHFFNDEYKIIFVEELKNAPKPGYAITIDKDDVKPVGLPTLEYLQKLENELQDLFPDKKIVIYLTENQDLDNVVKVFEH